MEFQLGMPYTIQFLRKYRVFMNNNASLYNLAKFIAEVALLDYSLAHILPSQVAAASMYLASCLMKTEFPEPLFEVMQISMAEIVGLAKKFVHPIQQWTSKTSKLQTLCINLLVKKLTLSMLLDKSYEKLSLTFKSNVLPFEVLDDLLPKDEI